MGHEYYVSISEKGAEALFNAKGILINSFCGDNDGFAGCITKSKINELNFKDINKISTLPPNEFQKYADKEIEIALNEAFSIGVKFNATKNYNQVKNELSSIFNNFCFIEDGDDISAAIITQNGSVYINKDGLVADGIFISTLANKFGDDFIDKANKDNSLLDDINTYITNDLENKYQEDITRDFFVYHYYGE